VILARAVESFMDDTRRAQVSLRGATIDQSVAAAHIAASANSAAASAPAGSVSERISMTLERSPSEAMGTMAAAIAAAAHARMGADPASEDAVLTRSVD